MGGAAYNRGSRAISMQYHMETCPGCCECRGYVPTPRPADWGSKVRAKAEKKARGLLRFLRDRGESPTAEDLTSMVWADERWSRAACADAATTALQEPQP